MNFQEKSEGQRKLSGDVQEEKLAQHDVDEDDEKDTLEAAIALSLQEERGYMDLQKIKR